MLPIWILRLTIVIIFLVFFLLRGTKGWGVGLLSVSAMVVLDALRSRGLLTDLDFFGWAIGGVIAAGLFYWFNSLLQSNKSAASSTHAQMDEYVATTAGDTGGFDRQLLFEQIRDNLGPDDVLDLIFDLDINENEVVNPGQGMPSVIMRVLDVAEHEGKLQQVAMSVERILTPVAPDHLPRAERLSAETPPHLLRQYLIANYDLAELAQLSAAIGVDWEEMGSEGKKTRVRRLLLYLQRRNRLDQLIALIRQPSEQTDVPAITIRSETDADIAAVRTLTIAAFDSEDEADINDALRKNGHALLSMVAEEDSTVVAHLMFSPVTIEADGTTVSSVGLGPVAVTPAKQRQGIGSALIRAGLDACREAGYEHIFLLGHKEYYPRFGFQPAENFAISYEGRAPFPSFMCIELQEGSLANVSGDLRFGSEFDEAA